MKIIIAIFFLLTIPTQVQALTPTQVFNKVKGSIVVVKTLDDKDGVTSQGSGVLISSGRVATNCHVVAGGGSYQVGRGNKFFPATIYVEDTNKDICILDAKGLAGKPAQFGKAANLAVGEPVYAVGAPKGLELSLSNGIVAQLRGDSDNPPIIQTTAAISPGSSGGGLFNKEGYLVGLTTIYVEGGQNLNFAMPVEWILETKPGKKTAVKDLKCKGQNSDLMIGTFKLRRSKEWHRMLDWCRKWTESCPESTMAWRHLGRAYNELSLYTDAINAYRQVLRINPKDVDASEDADAWEGIGNAYKGQKLYTNAITAYHKALSIESKDNTLDLVTIWSSLGEVYVYTGNRTAALDVVRELQRLDPNMANSLYNVIREELKY